MIKSLNSQLNDKKKEIEQLQMEHELSGFNDQAADNKN